MKTSTLATRLEQDVRELCLPEGRIVGTPGHAVAEAWVARRLGEIDCQPYCGDSFALPYHRDGKDFTNFAGVIPGEDRSLPPVLIGAHYDSFIPHPCADDNGAAVAITLAVGEAVAGSGGLERDLIVAIFDAEEPPHFQMATMGSNRFYEDQLDGRGVHFALISDLVGHDVSLPASALGGLAAKAAAPIAPLTFATGVESHPELPGIMGGLQVPDGMKLVATLNDYVGDMSDHGAFRRNGVPYLFLSCGHWEHYHRPTDTPDRLNYQKMAAIARYAESVCRAAAAATLPEFPAQEDTLDFERATWKKALGVLRKPLAKALGVSGFDSREDIDRAASMLQRLGL
ncbi:M28 family metallopeptidase [Haloferula sp. A504]|uniref:M28 family metallopeptidase n=1 Tax=Haloferula sp. A504 TaxID=3373601 RepID=UPI0031C4A41F|nr:M28 family peptidase [Verrucomicrobiaceae bacterium E54]